MEVNRVDGKMHQILVKLLDGKHRTLNFKTPIVTVETLRQKLQTLTSIPADLQVLLVPFNRPTILHHDHQTLDLLPQNDNFPMVVHLLLRLRGGKGGFGSLLRGAGNKAGQKKTNNFDACRDMSGRRLRHVNNEKKLDEWRAEAKDRELEKIAEQFIKKKAKETAKNGKGKGGENFEKYVDKYREDSAKCMEEVDKSVRECLRASVASKRKGAGDDESNSKRFKIWLGKRTVGDDNGDDMDEDEDDEDEDDKDEGNNKSVVTHTGDHSDSSKEAGGSSDSITGARHSLVSLDGGAVESGSEEEKEAVAEESERPGESDGSQVESTLTGAELGVSEEKALRVGVTSILTCDIDPEIQKEESKISNSSKLGERLGQPSPLSSSGEEGTVFAEVNGYSNPMPGIQDAGVSSNVEALDLEKPLNLEEFNSATELEALGMEKLKSELQARGLKCGGTLQERAARLFLLKTTPIEMLPKKLLAKK